MSKAGGVVLVLSGLAVGAYGLSQDGEQGFYGRTETDPGARPVPTASAIKVAGSDLVVPVPKPAYRPMPSSGPAEPVPSFSTPVVVTVAPRSGEPTSQPLRGSPIP